MRIGIACYPTYGGSGAVATELGMHRSTLWRKMKTYGLVR